MKYLITGGCGFLGANIACEILRKREELVLLDNLSRVGSANNLAWLQAQGQLLHIHADIRNPQAVEKAIQDVRPDVVYHLAGQVAMTTSIADPRLDFEVNALGSFNVLEAIRRFSPATAVVYSSTNKVYGDLEGLDYEERETRYVCRQYPAGFPESTPLDFHSPYGVSKGAADQYMLDYARLFGLKTVVFRHSSMYGGRQYATVDQGWVGWFCQQALAIRAHRLQAPVSISGNGKQVRDLLYASDMVNLYLRAAERVESVKGQVFNIGGGMENALSLLELFRFLTDELGIEMNYTSLPPRASDQKVFVADIAKARRLLNWTPLVAREEGIRGMLTWLNSLQP